VKGALEGDTGGRCVSKILTERRKEKERKKKRPGLDGRPEGRKAGKE
jgi:hypothetical protein